MCCQCMKQYCIMPNAPPTCQSSSSVWAHVDLRNLKNRTLRQAHMKFAPHPRIFIRSILSSNKGIFMSVVGNSNLFLNAFLFLSCSGFESLWGRDFPQPSRTDPRPIQPPVQLVSRLFLGVNWSGRGADHPIPAIVEITERVELHLCSSSRSSWPVIRWNLPLPLPFQSAHLQPRNCCQVWSLLHEFSWYVLGFWNEVQRHADLLPRCWGLKF